MAAGFAFLPSSAVCAPQTVAPPPHKAAPPGPPLRPCCSAGGPVDPPKSGAPARSSSVTPGHLGCGRCSSRPVQGRRGLLCWGLNRDPPQPPLSRCPLRMGWGLPSRRRSPPGRRPFRGGGSRPRPGPDLEAARSGFVWGGDVRVFPAPERPAAGSKLFGTLPGPRGTGRWGRFCPERLVGEDDWGPVISKLHSGAGVVKLTTSARAPLLAPENLGRVLPPGRRWRRGAGDRARVDVSRSANQPAPGSLRRTQRLPGPHSWLGHVPGPGRSKETLPRRWPTSAPAPRLDSRCIPLPLSSRSSPSLLLPPPAPSSPSSSPAGGGQVRAGPRR